jgi:tryptophanyl-tRNA synthetase
VGVPVGEDQVPHLELTREVGRRFNQMYCGVPTDADDGDHVKLGGIWPVPRAEVGKVGRLLGIDGKNKMSKSLGNAIYISDSPKEVENKVKKIFTGRQSPTEPGDIENALFQYVDTFIEDPDRVAELKRRYAAGDNLGDGHVKVEVAEAINRLLAPMRARRERIGDDDAVLLDILKKGCARANVVAEETLERARKAAGLHFFPRSVRY